MADGSSPNDEFGEYLVRVGNRVRACRNRLNLSRRELSERSGVSERYLAQLEAGSGNVSIVLLKRIADALSIPIAPLVDDGQDSPLARLVTSYFGAPTNLRAQAIRLLDPSGNTELKGRKFALIGLRGAGKSTLGRRVGTALGFQFKELNSLIVQTSGMQVSEIIDLYGQEGYRRLEKRAMEGVANTNEPVILAVAGGIVSDPETFEYLLSRFNTIWLKAAPHEHMERVRAQGDERPMAGNPAAMEELRGILQAREEQYARADAQIDTTGKDVTESTKDLLACLHDRLHPES